MDKYQQLYSQNETFDYELFSVRCDAIGYQKLSVLDFVTKIGLYEVAKKMHPTMTIDDAIDKCLGVKRDPAVEKQYAVPTGCCGGGKVI